jgi:hypothetical protein
MKCVGNGVEVGNVGTRNMTTATDHQAVGIPDKAIRNNALFLGSRSFAG